MQLRTSRTDALAILGAASLAIAGAMVVRHGQAAGWWLVAGCAGAAAAVFMKPFMSAVLTATGGERVEISEWGVRLFDPHALQDSLPWTDLTEVAVITTPHAPPGEDLYLVLRGSGERGLIVPHIVAVEADLIATLVMRLPGFDTMALSDAVSSYTDGIGVLWTAQPAAPRLEPAIPDVS